MTGPATTPAIIPNDRSELAGTLDTGAACLGCFFLERVQTLNYYCCTAQRLPDPNGKYTAMPSRCAVSPTYQPRYFAFGSDVHDVSRWMSPGPVEGWINVLFSPQAGQRIAFEYKIAPCPARVPGDRL